MPSTVTSSANPLPLGQVMYAMHDTVMICEQEGGHNDLLQQVSFSGLVSEPQAMVRDPIKVETLASPRSARALTDREGRPLLILLTTAGLSIVKMKGETSHLSVLPTDVRDVALVIGLEPNQTERPLLAVLVAVGEGFAVVQVDLDTGARGQPLHLPPAVKGRAVAAEMARNGASTMLAIATIDNGSLQVHVLDWAHLAAQVEAKLITTLSLGRAWPDPAAELASLVTEMRAGSADQQIAFAWADSSATCKVALVGWGDRGEAKILATAAPALDFAPPDRPAYRLAAADFRHNGTEQLVLGYIGTCSASKLGWPARPGCAALMLFSLEESTGSALDLDAMSKYVVGFEAVDNDFPVQGQKNVSPWHICELHISAGLFGSCLGVQINTAAWNLGAGVVPQREFSLPVLSGFVPVDPARCSFPMMPVDTTPPPLKLTGDPQTDQFIRAVGITQPVGVAHMCSGPGGTGEPMARVSVPRFDVVPRFFAFSCLNGRSVVLGAPTLTQKSRCTQILAIIQAPPFDRRVTTTPPSVSFATSSGESTGCTVSSDKSWTLSDDVSVNLGLGGLNLAESTHNSYLRNFGKSKDGSSSTNVQFHANFTDHDYLLVYEIGYNVWSYPIKRSSMEDHGNGEMLVILPQESTVKTAWIPAHNYGYRPKSEVGMLLSYVDLPREAYAEGNRLFKLFGITVTEKSDNSSVSFDRSNSTSNSDSKHFSVLNSVSDHLSLSGSTEMFSWLPASFGLNIASSHSYSDSNVENTQLTVHSNLSLSINSGVVKDTVYEYEITPYVYEHAKLGCLVLTWDVNLTGAAWRLDSEGVDASLTSPQVCLIRPVSESSNIVYRAFSRSIEFIDETDGTTSIVVEIFNNSLRPALHVACEFFLGKPELGDKHTLLLPEHSLGREELTLEIKPIERRKIALKGQKLTKPVYVTVQLFIGKIPQGVFWGMHAVGENADTGA